MVNLSKLFPSSTTSTALLAFLAGASLSLCAINCFSQPSSATPSRGTLTDAPVRGSEGPFFLAVDITFENASALVSFRRAFEPLAAFVKEQELGTLSYALLHSDKDPLRVQVFERYESKAYYLNVHRTSTPFLNFRAFLQQMIDSKAVTLVEGESYLATGIGFI